LEKLTLTNVKPFEFSYAAHQHVALLQSCSRLKSLTVEFGAPMRPPIIVDHTFFNQLLSQLPQSLTELKLTNARHLNTSLFASPLPERLVSLTLEACDKFDAAVVARSHVRTLIFDPEPEYNAEKERVTLSPVDILTLKTRFILLLLPFLLRCFLFYSSPFCFVVF
jgi:hypothetical protein